MIYDPAAGPGPLREVKEELPSAARALELTVRFWEVRRADAFDGVFAAIGKQRISGVYVPTGALVRDNV